MKNYDVCEICDKKIYCGKDGWTCGMCGRLVCIDCIDADGDCLECGMIKIRRYL